MVLGSRSAPCCWASTPDLLLSASQISRKCPGEWGCRGRSGPWDLGRAGILPFRVLKPENLRPRAPLRVWAGSLRLWPGLLHCPIFYWVPQQGGSPVGAPDAWSCFVLGLGSSEPTLRVTKSETTRTRSPGAQEGNS